MAVEKSRATTLQEKFGFKDEDLHTPKHDALMLWLDRNADELVQEFFAVPSDWPAEVIAGVRSEAAKLVESRFGLRQWCGLGAVPSRALVIAKKTWEKPIVTAKGYAIGFADMEVVAFRPSMLSFSYCDRLDANRPAAEWYVEIVKEHVVFEVKTAIRSVGELVRQIRLYQEYLKGHYIVVSPDDRFAEVLREQGIQFVNCNEMPV